MSEVASNGIGLAFIAFPTIISKAPFGALIGVLFFGSLVFAGLTSLISILEVVIAAVQDKMELGRVSSTFAVGVPMAVVSTLLFGTTTGLPVLDTLDKFVNTYGIVAGGALYVLALLLAKMLPVLRRHINSVSSFKVGTLWMVCVTATVAVLGYMLFSDTRELLKNNYSGYPTEFLNLFGWGMAAALPLLAILLSLLPWKRDTTLTDDDKENGQ